MLSGVHWLCPRLDKPNNLNCPLSHLKLQLRNIACTLIHGSLTINSATLPDKDIYMHVHTHTTSYFKFIIYNSPP